MSAFRIALNELRRLSTGTLPKLALLALVLVPLLYASFYLYANHDPYGRLNKLPAAVVVADTGAADQNGSSRNIGREISDELVKSGSFQWHEVSEQEAQSGVRNDKYSFSIGIPRDFSTALLSSGNFQPQQATITLTTNDANNYLSGTIADQVAEQIRKTITEKVGSEAADRFLVGFSTIYGKVQEAATGAAKLADGAGQLRTGQQQLADGAGKLSTGLATLKDNTAQLPTKSQELANGASQVSAGDAKIAEVSAALATGSSDLRKNLDNANDKIAQQLRDAGLDETSIQRVLDVLTGLKQPLDSANTKIQQTNGQIAALADGARKVADGAKQLADSTPALVNGISELSTGANQLNDGEKTAVKGTNDLVNGATQLSDGLKAGLAQIPNPDDPTRAATANTIANPVAVNSVGVASAGTYGAGLAPFFISLATWIGAFVLFLLLRPLSTRALTAGASPLRVALGGWFPSALLGAAQVIVLFGAVAWLVGINIAHPLGAIGFALLVTAAFTAVVHALNALLGAVGKFLGLVLLVLQLVSSGGTFPWQTIPDALYPLHIVLPMGYAIDGFRHLLYTGASPQILGDIGVLVGYLVLGLLVSTYAASKRRMWTISQLKPELAF
jgi:putative membrane protein